MIARGVVRQPCEPAFLKAFAKTLAVTVLTTMAFSVAAPALVPGLVGPVARGAANARIELARTLAFTAGPAAAGVLVGWSGAMAAFGLAVLLSVVAAMLLAGLAEPPRAAATTRRHWRSEAQAGARFVFSHAMLRPVFVTQFVYGVAFYTLYTAFVPYAVASLGLTAASVGLVLGVYGAGMICGVLAVAALLRRLALGVVIGIGPVAGFVASLMMLMTLGFREAWLAAASFFLIGFGGLVWVVDLVRWELATTLQGRWADDLPLVAAGRQVRFLVPVHQADHRVQVPQFANLVRQACFGDVARHGGPDRRPQVVRRIADENRRKPAVLRHVHHLLLGDPAEHGETVVGRGKAKY